MRPTDQLGAAAVAYARLGYRVLPLHHPLPATSTQEQGMHCSCGDPACGAVGKHPLTAHGLKDATSDSVQLAQWWRRWPQANLGLVTGELAEVLDIDGPAGRAALRRYVAGHDLRLDGPVVRTGSGWHYYVAPTGSGNRAGLLPQRLVLFVAAAAMWSPHPPNTPPAATTDGCARPPLPPHESLPRCAACSTRHERTPHNHDRPRRPGFN